MLSPVFNVQRCSVHDGPGLRTTVFLRGCPLRCAWCHNPEGLARVEDPPDDTWVDEVMREVLADVAFYEVSGGGLTLSGGEPLLHVARAVKLLEAARAAGLHTCVQTCGAVPESTLDAVLGLVDLFQFDLKHDDEAQHRRWTGAGLSRIHSNAQWLVSHGARVEFRMPVVPGVNEDAVAGLEALVSSLGGAGARLGFQPYHSMYLGKGVVCPHPDPLPTGRGRR